MQELKIGPNEAGQRFDKYLHKVFPLAPGSLLYKQLRKKNITLNSRKAEGKELLYSGDLVQCYFSQETFSRFRGELTDTSDKGTLEGRPQKNGRPSEYEKAYKSLQGISIIYEDANILILNKPVGILSQKAAPSDLSLNEWMIGYLLHSGIYSSNDLKTFRPSVCNRLDRNTSGLVLCGKTLSGSQALSLSIKNRSIRKFYKTICHGRLEKEETIHGYLQKDSRTNKVSVTDKVPRPGTEAASICTKYTPLQSNASYTLLEVELITGKTHQIRAHLASTGHALVGDMKYGKPRDNQETKKHLGLDHHLLHADHLLFPRWDMTEYALSAYENVMKPLSGMCIAAPLPTAFEAICTQLGFSDR